MKFNYGLEKKRFDAEWEKKSAWYRAEGMSEEVIHELFEYDWYVFKSSRIYYIHKCDISIEDVTAHCEVSEEYFVGRYDWIEALDSSELVKKLRQLSRDDIEIITLCMEGYTQTEIDEHFGCSQSNIAQKLERIKKILKNLT